MDILELKQRSCNSYNNEYRENVYTIILKSMFSEN